MGRNARVVLPGCAHHVTQRGNHQQDVFFCDSDRTVYLGLLRQHIRTAGIRLLGYCLMTNHVHLVVVPERTDSLARGLGRVHNDYARWMHIRQRRTGHLWQNRYFSCALSERHLAETLRYVEINPLRGKLVSDPCHWEWSSARARICGADPNNLIAAEDLGPYTGASWKDVLNRGWKAAEFEMRLRAATRVGRPIGDEAFICKAEQETGRRLRTLPRGRKPKSATSSPEQFALS